MSGVQVAIVLLLLGGAMNGLVIVANGRMPFSVAAARHADLPEAKITATNLPKNEPASTGTRLAWLGDRIPVRPIHKVMSAGDMVIMGGIALLIMAGMQPDRRPAPMPLMAGGAGITIDDPPAISEQAE